MSLYVSCSLCGDPVDAQSANTWHRVDGWERKARSASRRAGSDIACRRALEEFAHDRCVRRVQDGVSVFQEAFAP